MLFKGNKTAHYYPKISVDNKYITQVNGTKFLGIMIDLGSKIPSIWASPQSINRYVYV